ncbi:translation initiation factor IF-3 [Peptococcaceae bacterium]|nr:translation initiation factor IF-3 [Peptococcaceae bacterium]
MVKELRLVDDKNNQLGIMSLQEALRVAEERQLDLVEIAPQANPPVCRLMDYGKYKYEQSKKEKEAKKKQKIIQVKEIKMRPNIEEHDYQVKLRNVMKFLKSGNKVKATIMFRGREIVHAPKGEEILSRMAGDLKEVSVVERSPKLEGRNMVMVLSPKVDKKEIKKECL